MVPMLVGIADEPAALGFELRVAGPCYCLLIPAISHASLCEHTQDQAQKSRYRSPKDCRQYSPLTHIPAHGRVVGVLCHDLSKAGIVDRFRHVQVDDAFEASNCWTDNWIYEE